MNNSNISLPKSLRKYVESLNYNTLTECVRNWEFLETYGYVDTGCVLRKVTKEYYDGDDWVINMKEVMFEIYRFLSIVSK